MEKAMQAMFHSFMLRLGDYSVTGNQEPTSTTFDHMACVGPFDLTGPKESVGVVVPLLFRHNDCMGHVNGGDGAPWRMKGP